MNTSKDFQDILALPPTPENTDRKINLLIVSIETIIEESKMSRLAAEKAANAALTASQRYEPLSRLQRFAAVALGGVTGGSLVGLAVELLIFLVKSK